MKSDLSIRLIVTMPHGRNMVIDYIMSQRYYAEAARAKELYTEYERRLASGTY